MEPYKEDGESGPALPRGVLRPKGRGWAGEELELERKVNEGEKKSFAAVDKSQFYNMEVGVGYQARGVVRQKNVQSCFNSVPIVNKSKLEVNELEEAGYHNYDTMSQSLSRKKSRKGKSTISHREEKNRKKKKKKDRKSQTTKSPSHCENIESSLLDEMLACDAMKVFHGELVKMIRSE